MDGSHAPCGNPAHGQKHREATSQGPDINQLGLAHGPVDLDLPGCDVSIPPRQGLHRPCLSRQQFWKVTVQILHTDAIVVFQSLSHVRLVATPWTAALQASLSIPDSQSLFKFMSTQSVMSSNHLILCCPLLLLLSIFPSIKIFSNESVLHIRWSKYLASVLPMNIQRVGSIPGLGRSPRAGNSNPLQYSCLGNTHGQGSLADYGPQGCKELDTTEAT